MTIQFTRRGLLAFGGTLGAAATLAACGSTELPTPPGASGSATSPKKVDVATYDAVILAGPVADASIVDANPWASKIKKAGVLRRGGAATSPIFSLKDPITNRITGFDAGIADLLAHYILGGDDVSKLQEFSETSVDTRETMLQNNTVDTVVATYTITTARAEKIAFAGPYLESGTSVQVNATNTDIKGYEDLKGKRIATEQNSSAITAIDKYIPGHGEVQLFADNASCIAALQQGRVDAYVLDAAILMANVVKFPDLKVVGQPFTHEPYGIGVTKADPSAKEFVDDFLQTIYDSGDWKKLYEATISLFVDGDVPTPPQIGSVAGS